MAGSRAHQFLLHSAENISALLFGLAGAAMVARVFGPESLGRWSLVQSVSAICVAFATLGLEHFIVRDFARNRRDGELKGSILVVQSAGWVLYLLSLVGFFYFRGDARQEIYLIASVAISTYLLRVLFLKLYLQAINDARALAVSAVSSRIAALLFLVAGTVFRFPFDLMVLYLPLQAIVQAAMMYSGYRRANVHREPMEVSGKRISSMVTEAMPVFVSSLLYFGYSQADVILLSHFMSNHEVGVYAAAMRLVPQAVFLGHVTVITLYGVLSDKFHEDRDAFFAFAVKIARAQFALALLLAAAVSLSAPLLVHILYGSKFAESAAVLSVGVWAWLFLFPACLFSRLLVLGGLARYELIRALFIAPFSLALNSLLIPRYGYMAGAVVSVVCYLFADFLIYGVFRETRFIFRIGRDAIWSLFTSPLTAARETVHLFHHKS